jgi:hypothetical protein
VGIWRFNSHDFSNLVLIKLCPEGRMPSLTLILRFKSILLWAVTFLFLVLIICAISAAPQDQLNDARLAPVAAWLRGYPLYTPVSSGIINGNLYPPLGALAFAPAAIFGHPVITAVVGSMLAFVMTMSAGVLATCFCSRELHRWSQDAVLGSVLYLGLLLLTEGPNTVLFAIHVDAPAIALSLWGTIFYARWWAQPRPSSIALSGFLLASGVLAKQLLIVFAPPSSS